MEIEENRKGFLGLFPRWADLLVLCLCLYGFVWLQWWSLPRQPAFLIFIISLETIVFLLTFFFPSWGLFLIISVIPGITTSSLTLFNRINPTVKIGVFGPAALIPALAFVFGLWLRTSLKKEELQPNLLRGPLKIFMGLTILSAYITFWRYSDFWPLKGWYLIDRVVNTDGLYASSAKQNIIWTLTNYFTGPLLFLAVCQASWLKIKTGKISWKVWMLKYFFAPLLIGSLAPVIVGLMQSCEQDVIRKFINYYTIILLFLTICQALWFIIKNRMSSWRTCLIKYFLAPFFIGAVVPVAFFLMQKKDLFLKNDIWFGAHKFYIWPWMDRINATFFDPNALGSYLILAVPVALAGAILLISLRRWLFAPALTVIGGFVYCCMFFMLNSGSRMSFVGISLFLFFAFTILLVNKIEKIKTKIPYSVYKGICAFLFVLYISMICYAVYSAPGTIQKIKKNPKLSKTTLGKRFVKMDARSIGDIYKKIKKDRGVYARMAVEMIKVMPLTGVGLGSFISEWPNYRTLNKELVYVPDTACNYYLQIGSEQGLIALAIVFLIFAVWFRKWWNVMHNTGVYMYWLFIGSGIAAMLVVFLFGMHTLAHEIQCLFWICMVQPFIAQPEGWKLQYKSKYYKLLIFLICVIYFSAAISKLSLEKQKKKFGWDDEPQFYQWENWPDPNVPRVRYSKKESSEEIKCDGIIFEQKWCALHPDIEINPVTVSFQLGNQITNVVVKDNNWRTMNFFVGPENKNKKIVFSVNVSRTWKASALGMNSDKRKPGILLNEKRWKNSYGMYKKERWHDDTSKMSGKEYRWTEKNAKMLMHLTGKYIKIPLHISQPDVVSIIIGVNKTNLTEQIIADNAWHETILFCGDIFKTNEKNKNVVLDFSVDKTMTPENYGISDGRTLGVAVGNPVSIKDFGFYDKEKWENDYYYRWAGKEARWAEKSNSNGLINILYFVNHPDIIDESVEISFYVNGERKRIKDIYYPNWKIIELHAKTNSWNDIIVKVNRTWKPKEFGVNDDRKLGFAIKYNQ